MSTLKPDSEIPEGFSAKLKPFRVLRKRMAAVCLFLVITIIILGMQVYSPFGLTVNIILIALTLLLF